MRQGWLRGVHWLATLALLALAAPAAAKEPQIELEPAPADAGNPAENPPVPRDDERLVAIGALSSAHLYTTYAYIGTVADAHRQGAYKTPRVRQLMTEVINLSEASTRHLVKVRDGKLAASDKQVIEDFLEVYKLLAEEADALIDYSRSQSKDDLTRFNGARTAAWPKLKTILGIKEPAPEAEEK